MTEPEIAAEANESADAGRLMTIKCLIRCVIYNLFYLCQSIQIFCSVKCFFLFSFLI